MAKIQKTFNLDPETVSFVEKYCAEKRIPQSQLIREMLQKFMSKQTTKPVAEAKPQ